MPDRKFNSGSYRYGFNGKENDNEVKGEGNQQDYGMRIYDPRVGRFLSVDPLSPKYPELTPYQFSGNSPIVFTDRDGEEAMYRMPDGNTFIQPPSDHLRLPIPQNVLDHGQPVGGEKADLNGISLFLDLTPGVGTIKGGAGRTLLHHSVISGHLSVVEYLVSCKPDLNVHDSLGWVSLHYAVQQYRIDIVKFLIKSGSEVNAVDNYGNNVLWRAIFESKGRGK